MWLFCVFSQSSYRNSRTMNRQWEAPRGSQCGRQDDESEVSVEVEAAVSEARTYGAVLPSGFQSCDRNRLVRSVCLCVCLMHRFLLELEFLDYGLIHHNWLSREHISISSRCDKLPLIMVLSQTVAGKQ